MKTEEKRGRSKYARKMRRKLGRGKVDPRWMWWLERPAREAGAR